MFAVSTSYDGGIARVAITGEVDLASVVALRKELHAVALGEGDEVEVDLRNVDLVDSIGIGLLLGAARRTRERGARFSVSNCPDHVAEAFDRCGVADQLMSSRGVSS